MARSAVIRWALALSLIMGSATGAVPMSVQVVSPLGHQALAADLAVNSQGDIALLWVDRSPTDASPDRDDRHIALTDLYVAVSTDGGDSFSAPVKVNEASGVVWGQAVSRPRIVGMPDRSWHVVYAANELHPTLGSTALTTQYTRSLDNARTFESPRRLSTLTDQDMSEVIHGGFVSAAAFSTIAATERGTLAVLWIDTRHMDESTNTSSLYARISRDSGASFEREDRLIANGVCPCCQLMAIDGGEDRLLMGSRAVDDGNYRPATVLRISLGQELSSRREIGDVPWQIEGCPLKPTVLARHGQNVFASVHSGGGETHGVIFSVSQDGGLTFASRGLVHADAAVSDSPSLATNGRTVLLAWHARTSGPWTIHYQFYDLQGRSLGPVESLVSPGGAARSPVVVQRADGHYQVAWQQGGRILTSTLPDRSR